MRELLRTNDPVRLSWLTALLADQQIEAFVLDTHTSILEGSAGAIPRRLLVSDEDFDAANRLLGLRHRLVVLRLQRGGRIRCDRLRLCMNLCADARTVFKPLRIFRACGVVSRV